MPPDIVAVLDEGHARLMQAGGQLRACAQQATALAHFNQFAVALGGHLSAMRKVVYPALKSIGWKNVSSTLLVGHARLTHVFAELLTLKQASGVFAEALHDLLDATERLLERERLELFPLLREQLPTGARLAMAVDAAQYLPPQHPSDHASPSRWRPGDGVRRSTREWVEEARLLLGGMQAQDEPATPAERPPLS